ncbi:hypothetical protein [Pseudochelatococcus contaminans]|uniref:Uncharacterized protein n=1 Tax=Pseudochelatococcus contaminans TaxID=1538103 RepID=A0A7W5Z3E7_9HYPH|nr:hypothetical protein [Pseudochelatococcus contaminans]MBB3809100.1 hypothetical protein [Pseudochelatococcus contaminans]
MSVARVIDSNLISTRLEQDSAKLVLMHEFRQLRETWVEQEALVESQPNQSKGTMMDYGPATPLRFLRQAAKRIPGARRVRDWFRHKH